MSRTKEFDEKEVLEKAMELFWKQGYHNTSMQELVDYLGINRGSLYDTYGGKKDLFDKSFHHYRVINLDNLRKYFSKQSDVKEGFRNLFLKSLNESACDAEKKGCFVINTISEFVPTDLEIENQIKHNHSVIKSIFFDFIEAGKQSGSITTNLDSTVIANLYFTIYNGLQIVTKVEQDNSEMMDSIDAALSLLQS